MPPSPTNLEPLRHIARKISAQINAGAAQRRQADDAGGPLMKGLFEAYELGFEDGVTPPKYETATVPSWTSEATSSPATAGELTPLSVPGTTAPRS